MIFKIQQSLFDSEGAKRILVYNKQRTIESQFVVGDDHPLLELLGDRPKVYVQATLIDGVLDIKNEVRPRNW